MHPQAVPASLVQRWVVSPRQAGASRAGESGETAGVSSRDLVTPCIAAAAQLLQHEAHRAPGATAQQSEEWWGTGTDEPKSVCRGLQKSKLRPKDSDTAGAGSVRLIHMQFSDGIDRMVFNWSTRNEPSISPFWNTLFSFERAVMSQRTCVSDCGGGRSRQGISWEREQLFLVDEEMRDMKMILWHLHQIENTAENIAQCRVLCHVCSVPCAPLRACLVLCLCNLRVGRSPKSHRF